MHKRVGVTKYFSEVARNPTRALLKDGPAASPIQYYCGGNKGCSAIPGKKVSAPQMRNRNIIGKDYNCPGTLQNDWPTVFSGPGYHCIARQRYSSFQQMKQMHIQAVPIRSVP